MPKYVVAHSLLDKVSPLTGDLLVFGEVVDETAFTVEELAQFINAGAIVAQGGEVVSAQAVVEEPVQEPLVEQPVIEEQSATPEPVVEQVVQANEEASIDGSDPTVQS
ncbi:MAG: hypothetical protein HXX08_11335 [Chloroflexi bacterium]|uniref:Uncharacterized protein n=1 Tax=Candidatus Chlorohelix allophototropha TaxID=3003348 RepID=A0A8T7M0V8_9CHLR|nr:hypothetical protein [Chloroflexota bacterium]WJW65830.1 hypothetical protein OZ401_001609 [Chloroflexota bacterium L227-S17]